MKNYQTNKLYLGFPVYIVSTTDDQGTILVATMSSSYSLGNVLVMGMSKQSNTFQYIEKGKQLALNYLSHEQGLLSDIGGWSSGATNKDKANTLQSDFSFHNNVPYLTDAMVTILGTVTNIVEDEQYAHIFLEIAIRKLNPNILNSADKLEYSKMNPLIYLGDDKRRAYKYTNETIVYSGGFIKMDKQ